MLELKNGGLKMKSVVFTIKSLMETFDVIRDAKLKKYYFLPGIINMALVYLLYQVSKLISKGVYTQLENLFKINSYESIAYLAIKILVVFVAFLLYFFVYKALLLVILSPFLSYISERVETHVTKKEFNFTLKENIHFISRGVVVSLSSLLKEAVATLVFLTLSVITPLNLFTPFFIFLVQCYFIGFSFIDYALERHGFSSKEGTSFLRKNALFSIINGGIFVAILVIPIVGVFIAPLVSAVSINLGTIKILKDYKRDPDFS